MIINEKGLVKAMKDAYKSGSGYKVVGYGAEDDVWISIMTGAWLVQIHMDNIPRKALGLIAEHAGRLPRPNEAYLVKKGEVQDEIFDMAMKPQLHFEDTMRISKPKEVKRTPLLWKNRQVWQQDVTMKTVLVSPEFMRIVDQDGPMGLLVEDAIYFPGEVSRAYIMRIIPDEADKPMTEHLDAMQWVAM